MNIINFSIARLPRIEFGTGVFSKVADICEQYGKKVLIVTGAHSFRNTISFIQLENDFKKKNFSWEYCSVENEPSPQLIDNAVKQYASDDFDVVLGIGGGSALDAAKAIAGLLKVKHSVMDYLEGVGPELKYEGPALPFIAVPTTAGTGSEATKNAVLSVQGKDGFKKSFRDDQLVAEYAIVDPALLSTCPKSVVAANGMDALTQLLESYVSTNSNPLTDALALSGLRMIKDALLPMYERGIDITEAQEKMSYASLLSGICLAQTGLGSVHGLASPLGAFYPIPHGVVCGTLVASASDANIMAMLGREPNNPALDKYATLGDVLCGTRHNNKHASWEALCGVLKGWTKQLNLQKLSEYGLTEDGLPHVIANCRGSSMKTNPVILTDEEIRELLISRL
jgi:alcohol dehydrogenase class IV